MISNHLKMSELHGVILKIEVALLWSTSTYMGLKIPLEPSYRLNDGDDSQDNFIGLAKNMSRTICILIEQFLSRR